MVHSAAKQSLKCVYRAMLHDPHDYPDPERFNPDRFIKEGALNPDVPDPTKIIFGFGRRYVTPFTKSHRHLTLY